MDELAAARRLESRLIPLSQLQLGLPAVTVQEAGLGRLAHGGMLPPEEVRHQGPETFRAGQVRLLGPEGQLLAVGEQDPDGRGIQPRVVLVRPEEILLPERPIGA
jgi:hypothetical protein